MISSIKKESEFISHYENLIDYVDEKINDILTYLSDVNTNYTLTQNKINEVITIVSEINSKLPEDAVDVLNSFGTYDDFIDGFNEGLG